MVAATAAVMVMVHRDREVHRHRLCVFCWWLAAAMMCRSGCRRVR